jgi:hypothetical protein
VTGRAASNGQAGDAYARARRLGYMSYLPGMMLVKGHNSPTW